MLLLLLMAGAGAGAGVGAGAGAGGGGGGRGRRRRQAQAKDAYKRGQANRAAADGTNTRGHMELCFKSRDVCINDPASRVTMID